MTAKTIPDVFWRRVEEIPSRVAIHHKVDGTWQTLTWAEHGRTVELVSAALLSQGIASGDHVGILSNNRPSWTWADFAILTSNAVTVPIYPTLAPAEVHFIASHSDVKALFISNAHQIGKVLNHVDPPPSSIRFIVLMDGEAPVHKLDLKIFGWSEFLALGEEFLRERSEELEARRNSIDPDSLATIVYTSGTTGIPKGAMLLHRNLFAVTEAAASLINFTEDDLALSFLPLSHVYERVSGQFLTAYTGTPVAYCEAMEQVVKALEETKPTVLNAVPRFYEKAYARVQTQIRQMPPTRQAFIRWAISIGMRATKQRVEKRVEPKILDQLFRAELRIAERLVFRKIRERFGGRLRLMTSGAAPLSHEVHIFFEAVGMPIVEGYGLTETCAALCCNRPNDNRFRSVGKPLPGVEVKLAEDGELLVRGPTVFAGYYKNPEATQQAFEGDWFKTGDIARIDTEGYIQITDRKKDIIITAGGKHVAPQFIENLFKSEPLIAHVVAYGDRRKYITGLVTLNPEALEKFAIDHGIKYDGFGEASQHPKVRAEVERVVYEKNKELARFQRIKKFVILEQELTIESNDLTPTLKVRRKSVTEKYRDILDGLYENEDLEVQQTTSEVSQAAQ